MGRFWRLIIMDTTHSINLPSYIAVSSYSDVDRLELSRWGCCAMELSNFIIIIIIIIELY